MKYFLSACIFIFVISGCKAQKNSEKTNAAQQGNANLQLADRVITGDERIDVYLPLIQGKRIGIFANQTSMVGNTHIVDTLRKLGLNIQVIFGPEHGFRGVADAGETVGNYIDKKTGIIVISLYGNKRKPTPEDLKDIDILVFDIQDVGVRFYTYISSLQDFMEAAFENSKPLLLLDRPNPNGFYVDGPVLDPAFRSYVGMQPVPIVYGMTLGEYAMMIAGERWLTSEKANLKYDYYKTAENSPDTAFHFLVIKNKKYDHKTRYSLPVRPSPNLPDMGSVYLYPSTCFFEGTVLSEGRGTNKPFQQFGHPLLPSNLHSFTPQPNEGAKSSKHYNEKCYGWDLSGTIDHIIKEVDNHVQVKWLIQAYQLFPGKDSFFLKTNYIDRLAGTSMLRQQVIQGKTEEEIRKSWEPDLQKFKGIRKKYLLYDDFE